MNSTNLQKTLFFLKWIFVLAICSHTSKNKMNVLIFYESVSNQKYQVICYTAIYQTWNKHFVAQYKVPLHLPVVLPKSWPSCCS